MAFEILVLRNSNKRKQIKQSTRETLFYKFDFSKQLEALNGLDCARFGI